MAVAIDGRHPSSSTLGYAFTEASLRRVPVLVIHAASASGVVTGRAGHLSQLWLEILAGWKTDYPDIDVDTLLLAGSPRDAVATVSADGAAARRRESLTAAVSGPAGSVPLRAPSLIRPHVQSPSFHSARPRSATADQPAARSRTPDCAT